MAIQFDFGGRTLTAPARALIGVLGDTAPILAARGARVVSAPGPLDLSPAPLVVLNHAFALMPALERAEAWLALEALRRGGSTIFLISHEEALLERWSDEIWWIEGGALKAKGDPREVLTGFRADVAQRLVAWGSGKTQPLAPSMRRGDGRAELLAIETLGPDDQPSLVWTSGEMAGVRIQVRYHEQVEKAVIGVMIRTRVGFEVYGTNTELERIDLGILEPGRMVTLTYRFRCNLCAQEYTVTAASHDPDGTPHDWMDDAVAVAVADSRYTAGVANLRAKAECSITR